MKTQFLFLSLFFVGNCMTMAEKCICVYRNGLVNISVHCENKCVGDSIFIQYFPSMLNRKVYSEKKEYACAVNRNGISNFCIKDAVPFGYIFLYGGFHSKNGLKIPILNGYLIPNESDIKVFIRGKTKYSFKINSHLDYNISFSGKGSEVFDFIYDWENPQVYSASLDSNIPIFDPEGSYNINNKVAKGWERRIKQTLTRFNGRINKQAYSICRADMIGTYLYNLANQVNTDMADSLVLKKMANSHFVDVIKRESLNLDDFSKGFSKNYFEGVYYLEITNFMFSHHVVSSDFYNLLKCRYKGELREKLLTYFFVHNGSQVANIDSLLQDGLANINMPYYKTKIEEVKFRLKGSIAFNFSLEDIKGDIISLNTFKNKIVFLDFYFLGCSACKGYYNSVIRDVEDTFRGNRNIIFIAISIDLNKDTWLNAIKSGSYTRFDQDNVLNLYTEGKGIEHSVIKYYNVQGYPCPILIDSEGRIFEYDGNLRNKEYLIKCIKSILNISEYAEPRLNIPGHGL